MRAGASGVAWDRGDTRAPNVGSTRPRHDGDVRAKYKGGMAMDNGAGGQVAWLWMGPWGYRRHMAVGV